ncbi:homeobox protein PKNOX1-like isoform X4 [Oncorhynchus masou masou]|uniref:homeobox protein PKNOX1-like isoform X4 n=1 Tax=Oncorhynchus masou masou TaxID=90313 RepID=UPI00318325D5
MCGFMSLSRSANSPHPYNASVFVASAVNMMAAQSVSLDKYTKREQQGVEQKESDADHADHDQKFSEERLAAASSPAPTEPQTPFDVDKASIYRHPLFPLLALLFEKCEQSTQGSDCITSASFDVDIENFVCSQEKEGKAFFSEDPDLDNLMVKAIQVLRIHLLELEKTSSSFKGTLSPQGIVVAASALRQGNVTVNPIQVMAGGEVYQPVTVVNSQGQLVSQTPSPQTIHIQNTQLQLQLNQDLSFFGHSDSSSKNKRGVLPKQATNVMRSWLFQHIGHPYPTEDEKKQIATQTNLSLLQVNNWFINARRRILQPMLDASSSETAKTKKPLPNRPLQRFWPDSIATGMTQQQVQMADGTMVTMSVEGLQSLTSDGATLAVQQVIIGGHSEDESGDSGDDEMTGLGLDNSDSLQ